MRRSTAKTKVVLLASALASGLTAWLWPSACTFAWAAGVKEQLKQDQYVPSESTLEQNVKDAHTIAVPPDKGEVDIGHLQGKANTTIFPDASLQTPTVEALPEPTVKLTQTASEADPNHGEKEREAAARGHGYLANGTKLLITDKENIVETPFGDLHVEPSSVVLIVCKPSVLAIYDLHDGSKHAINLSYHGTRPIDLLPGQALAITNGSETTFEEINPAPWVMYRRLSMTNKELPDLNVFRAEFNMAGMITGFPQLKSLSSSDDPAKKKAMSNMLKTAAIIHQVRGQFEPYQYYWSKELKKQLELQRQKQQH